MLSTGPEPEPEPALLPPHAVDLSLQASPEPPALRWLCEQYRSRCDSTLVAMRTRHAALQRHGARLSQEQCDAECDAAAACARTNADALQALLRLDAEGADSLPVTAAQEPPNGSADDGEGGLSLYDDAEQVLLHAARDWADGDGALAAERHRIVTAVASLLSTAPLEQPRSRRVLVLGSGLGRLAFDVARSCGCDVDAVDASLAMTLAAATAAAHALGGRTLRAHPWLLRTANLRTTAARLRSVDLPTPAAGLPTPAAAPRQQGGGGKGTARLRFRHGRFPPAQPPRAEYDAVLSSYFIDSASDDAADVIAAGARALRPGGYWLNVGPLKWGQVPGRPAASHYTWEELLMLLEARGFELLPPAEHGLVAPGHGASEWGGYLPRCGGEMQQEVYHPGAFVARLR